MYSTSVWSVVLLSTAEVSSLHSIEDASMLLVQVMVAGWPTVRGDSRPDSVIPVLKDRENIEYYYTCICHTYFSHNSPTAVTLSESEPKSLETVQV